MITLDLLLDAPIILQAAFIIREFWDRYLVALMDYSPTTFPLHPRLLILPPTNHHHYELLPPPPPPPAYCILHTTILTSNCAQTQQYSNRCLLTPLSTPRLYHYHSISRIAISIGCNNILDTHRRHIIPPLSNIITRKWHHILPLLPHPAASFFLYNIQNLVLPKLFTFFRKTLFSFLLVMERNLNQTVAPHFISKVLFFIPGSSTLNPMHRRNFIVFFSD